MYNWNVLGISWDSKCSKADTTKPKTKKMLSTKLQWKSREGRAWQWLRCPRRLWDPSQPEHTFIRQERKGVFLVKEIA